MTDRRETADGDATDTATDFASGDGAPSRLSPAVTGGPAIGGVPDPREASLIGDDTAHANGVAGAGQGWIAAPVMTAILIVVALAIILFVVL